MRGTIYIIAIFLFGNTLIAQQNQAYIEYDKVLHSISVYSKTKEEISIFRHKLNDSIQAILAEHELVIHKSSFHKAQLTPIQICKLERKLRQMENRIADFKKSTLQEMKGNDQELQSLLKAKIDSGVQQYCAENRISIMVDKNAILFCEDCVNHTDRLIRYLQKNHQQAIANRI